MIHRRASCTTAQSWRSPRKNALRKSSTASRPVPFSVWELSYHAIDYCLAEAGMALNDVDHVAYSLEPSLLVKGSGLPPRSRSRSNRAARRGTTAEHRGIRSSCRTSSTRQGSSPVARRIISTGGCARRQTGHRGNGTTLRITSLTRQARSWPRRFDGCAGTLCRPDEHRQPRRVHRAGACRTRSHAGPVTFADRVRAGGVRRSATAPSRHLACGAHPRSATAHRARRRTRAHDRIFPPHAARRAIAAARTLPLRPRCRRGR